LDNKNFIALKSYLQFKINIILKSDIIKELQKGLEDVKLNPIKNSFPNGIFPLEATHEFVCMQSEDAACTSGFIAGVLGELMQANVLSFSCKTIINQSKSEAVQQIQCLRKCFNVLHTFCCSIHHLFLLQGQKKNRRSL
jgi:hypothetical protein